MDSITFQNRIGYLGNFDTFIKTVVGDYELGKLLSFAPILQGYEDFNIKVETDSGKYLIKMMGMFRSDKETKQYADIIQIAVDNGVSHPKLYQSSQGNLYKASLDGKGVRLVVMDFVEGKDFYTLGKKPTKEEMTFLAQQAAKINKIDFKPQYTYDSWAIPNFLKEYKAIKDKLDNEDLRYVESLAKIFSTLHLEKLPHAFVHGDIISTNVLRSNNNKIYIIDFAVANYYPRIQELAVLLCDLFFVKDKSGYLANYNLALEEYQKIIKLESRELDILPTYIKLAHAMHIVPATREKVKGNKLPENDFWLKSGQDGLRLATEIWG